MRCWPTGRPRGCVSWFIVKVKILVSQETDFFETRVAVLHALGLRNGASGEEVMLLAPGSGVFLRARTEAGLSVPM